MAERKMHDRETPRLKSRLKSKTSSKNSCRWHGVALAAQQNSHDPAFSASPSTTAAGLQQYRLPISYLRCARYCALTFLLSSVASGRATTPPSFGFADPGHLNACSQRTNWTGLTFANCSSRTRVNSIQPSSSAQHLRPSGVLSCWPDGLELSPGLYP